MADRDENKAQSILPLARIRTIMKSSPDTSSISHEALFITGKATEMFVQNLARVSMENSSDPRNVNYSDLADVVNSDEVMQFLQDIVPQKIKARDYLESLKKGGEGEEEENSS